MPLRYVGGKFKIAKPISEIILSKTDNETTFVSLFCGSCAVEARAGKSGKYNKIILNDIHPYLIAMYKAYREGYQFPEKVTKEQYTYTRLHKDENPALTGFIGFGCSFGGKWFGGYGKNIKSKRNLASEAVHSLDRDMKYLMDAEFSCKDYRDVIIPDNSIVYCDPPYDNTTGYRGLKKFDTEAFWEYIREISKKNKVFVSE